MQGYATVDRGELSWSPHVAELRVLVSAEMRGKGLGRMLTQEALRDCTRPRHRKNNRSDDGRSEGRYRRVPGHGIPPRGVVRDHVKDREGRKYDLLILAHEVAKFQSRWMRRVLPRRSED